MPALTRPVMAAERRFRPYWQGKLGAPCSVSDPAGR